MVGFLSQLVTMLLILMALGIVEKTFFIGNVISKDHMFIGSCDYIVNARHSESPYHV